MPLYVYLKAPRGKKKIFFKSKAALSRFRDSKFKKILFLSLIPFGFILISSVFYYAFSYKMMVFKKSKEKITAPISEIAVAEAHGLVNPLVAGAFTQKGVDFITVAEKEIDYDLINNWFPTALTPKIKKSRITHYALSIPKLKIENGVVEVGGTKIKESLVHYPGTALPGEFGNVVVFGHSTLPMFYKPTDYKTIFSLIPTLENGDKIHLFFDGIEYVYEVFNYKEVKPEEINVLEQRFDQQSLSLITCVPPGTYLKRGIIRARLTKI